MSGGILVFYFSLFTPTFVSSSRLYICQKYLVKSAFPIGCPLIRILSVTWTRCGELHPRMHVQVFEKYLKPVITCQSLHLIPPVCVCVCLCSNCLKYKSNIRVIWLQKLNNPFYCSDYSRRAQPQHLDSCYIKNVEITKDFIAEYGCVFVFYKLFKPFQGLHRNLKQSTFLCNNTAVTTWFSKHQGLPEESCAEAVIS